MFNKGLLSQNPTLKKKQTIQLQNEDRHEQLFYQTGYLERK
jgi:hypothetical protein